MRKYAILLMAFLLIFSGCSGGPEPALPSGRAFADAPENSAISRSHPGYVQWLERQSLLRKSHDLTAIVTGSALPWSAPSTISDHGTLLRQASVWLNINPRQTAWAGNAAFLQALSSQAILTNYAKMGIDGLLIAPLTETSLSVNLEGFFAEQGQDTVSFDISQEFGGEAAYFALEKKALELSLHLGGNLIPSATGLGPDFSLAMRGVRDYPGLYLMVMVPPNLWSALPLITQNMGHSGRELRQVALDRLAKEQIIPPFFASDLESAIIKGGWAATPEVVGVDGVNRRWVYRYSGSTLRPVLNWDDPSGAARRVLTAGIIQQAGLLHQPLVGLSIEAWWGQDTTLDPGPAPQNDSSDKALALSGEPALSALRSLSRDIRRYGAWSLLRDEFPPSYIPLLQSAGVDFVFDSILGPGLEYALLTGDTKPLTAAIDSALRQQVDHARLWRAPASGEGLNLGLIDQDPLQTLLAWEQKQAINKEENLKWVSLLGLEDKTLYAGAAGLAAMVSGLAPDRLGQPQNSPVSQQARDAHLLQIAFRAFQPGLLVLSGRDLTGATFAPSTEGVYPSQTGWSLDGVPRNLAAGGLTANSGLYPSLSAQLQDPESFCTKLQQVLKIREQTGIAAGRVLARADTSLPETVAVLSALPDGNRLLVAVNFSKRDFVTDVRFAENFFKAGGALDLLSGSGVANSSNFMRLHMPSFGFRVIHLTGN